MTPGKPPRIFGWRFSPTKVRLVAGFLLPLAAFAAAAVLSMRNMERIVHATDTIRRLQMGLKSALTIQSLARDLNAAQADFSLGEDLATIDWFHSAREQMRRERASLGDALETDAEREIARRIGRLERDLSLLFDTELVPAVMEGDLERIRALRRETGLFDEIIHLTEELVGSLQGRIRSAAWHAEQIRIEAVRDSGVLFAVAVALAVAMALLAARSVIRPIMALIAGTEVVGSGRLDHRIRLPRRDEFGQLAESFNRMTAELGENQRRLVQAQKMASLGRLAAGVAHEINNPIGVIMGYANMLAKDPALPETAREDLRTIEEEARQCKRIVEDLLALSRPGESSDEEIDVADLIRKVAERARRAAPHCEVEAAAAPPESGLRVRGDRDKLRQVLDNLARNAAEALPDSGGRLALRARREGEGESARVVVEVEDNGVGMNEEQCEHVFDPFYSTKSGGTGLGLWIAYSIVQSHRGAISVRSAPGEGATFTIALPAADARS